MDTQQQTSFPPEFLALIEKPGVKEAIRRVPDLYNELVIKPLSEEFDPRQMNFKAMHDDMVDCMNAIAENRFDYYMLEPTSREQGQGGKGGPWMFDHAQAGLAKTIDSMDISVQPALTEIHKFLQSRVPEDNEDDGSAEDDNGGELVSIQDLVNTATAFKAKGNEFFKLGEWEGAIVEYRKGLATVEECGSRLNREGLTLQQEASKLKIAIWGNLSQALINVGRPSEAIPLCDKVLEKDPKNEKALFRRGKAKGATKQWDAGIKDLTTLLNSVNCYNGDAAQLVDDLKKEKRAFTNTRHFPPGGEYKLFIHTSNEEYPKTPAEKAEPWQKAINDGYLPASCGFEDLPQLKGVSAIIYHPISGRNVGYIVGTEVRRRGNWFEQCDDAQQELCDMCDTLFDFDSSKLKTKFKKEWGTALDEGKLLVIDSIEIVPEHRGKGVLSSIAKELVEFMQKKSHAACILLPGSKNYPEIPGKETDAAAYGDQRKLPDGFSEEVVKKLVKNYSEQLGFHKLGDSDYLAMIPDIAHKCWDDAVVNDE